MKAYGLHKWHVNPWEHESSVKSKTTERFAGKQEVKREFDQMINDYNYYIWSDYVEKGDPYYCCDDHYFGIEMDEARKSGLLR